MKNALMALAVVGAVGCLAGPLANAASDSTTSHSARTHHSYRTHTAARHHRYHGYRGYRGSGYAFRDYNGWGYGRGGWGWGPGDPTAGPHSLLSYYRHNNVCAIDEGYGRATRCD